MRRDRQLDRIAARLDAVRPVVPDEGADLYRRLNNAELLVHAETVIAGWRAEAQATTDAAVSHHLLALADELGTTIEKCGPTLRGALARRLAEGAEPDPRSHRGEPA